MALLGVLATHLHLATPKKVKDHVGPARRCLQGEVTLSNQETCWELAGRGAFRGKWGRVSTGSAAPGCDACPGMELLGVVFTL